MPKRIPLAEHDTLEGLKVKLKSIHDPAHKTRIRAIINTKKGSSRKEVSEVLSVSYDTIGDWVKKYNEGGVAALKTNKGGRSEGNPKWDTRIFDDLTKEIDKGGRYWSIPLMCAWIKDHKKREIPENTVWYHMADLKYSYKSARPHPYKGDTEKQEAFKKGGW